MNIINEDTFVQLSLSQLSLQYSESCELSLCSGHCLEQFINKIITDSAKQFTLRMRSILFYWQPLLFFQFAIFSGFVRFRIKGVRISEVLLYNVNLYLYMYHLVKVISVQKKSQTAALCFTTDYMLNLVKVVAI